MCITFYVVVDNVEKLFGSLYYKGGYVHNLVDNIEEV
ncbi:conserved hypothetical protein [Bacillus mycoides KBAB4]|uniref:Uncharacterized protein n=1 Tax=Bacillus mycoides (strain KBAB4) TaxID=315730 RepID=A9VQG2_BACMK|nr:conserved hypothetical protein [Bacillus mycoides KBAB4]